jgi:hypothetical protein
MADMFELTPITYAEASQRPEIFEIYEKFRKVTKRGKKPLLFEIDLECDTLSGTLADIAKPTNLVNNWTTGQQIYIRSTNALDVSKTCRVWGVKVGETDPKWHILTTDAADGTTPVDSGLFYNITTDDGIDTCAGNLIIDDDGASTTVFFTLTLGVSTYTGYFIVPNGYKGAILDSYAHLKTTPANAAAGVFYFIGEEFGPLLTTNSGDSEHKGYSHEYASQGAIQFQGEFTTSMTDSLVHNYLMIWV